MSENNNSILVKKFLQQYTNLVELYRSETSSPEDINNERNRISEIDIADALDDNYNPVVGAFVKYVNLLLEQPLVYLTLMEAFVYLNTFPNVVDSTVKITNAVKYLFRDEEFNEKRAKQIVGEEKFVQAQQSINLTATRSEAKRAYREFLIGFLTKNASGQIVTVNENITEHIELLVNVADLVLGNDIGTRALKACKDAVYTDSALKLTTYVGCKNNFFSTEKQAQLCPQGAFEDLKNDLLQAVGLQL